MKKMCRLMIAGLLLCSIKVSAMENVRGNENAEHKNEKPSLPFLEKKEGSTFFEQYANDNVPAIAKELAGRSNSIAVFDEIIDEAIEKKDFPTAEKGRRDREIAKGAIAGQQCNQWWDIGKGVLIGGGSFAVGLALYYLFNRPMNDNAALNRLSDTIKDAVAQIIAQKNDTGAK